jgi:hypothetical protein
MYGFYTEPQHMATPNYEEWSAHLTSSFFLMEKGYRSFSKSYDFYRSTESRILPNYTLRAGFLSPSNSIMPLKTMLGFTYQAWMLVILQAELEWEGREENQ